MREKEKAKEAKEAKEEREKRRGGRHTAGSGADDSTRERSGEGDETTPRPPADGRTRTPPPLLTQVSGFKPPS